MGRINKIRKRDGSVVLFEESKISEAIWKAVRSVGGTDKKRAEELSHIVCKKIDEKYLDGTIPSVEDIQDLVEKTLIEEGHAKTAKAYILYRKSHQELREVKGLFDTIEVVEKYVGAEDWMVKENSNMGYSLQGLNNYIATKIITNYWMRRIYPEAIRNAHQNVDLHIHDLGVLGAYCVGWDLKDLLLTGFKGVPGKVESKPPKHFRTALGQIVNFFYTLQGETAGAQAFSNFDTLLAPFIRYDNLSYEQVKQSMQEFLFNLSVPTRVGFQSPFTNITMDLECPNFMREEHIVIGGQFKNDKYGDFQREMDMLNKAFAECMMEGDASGRVFTFPIPTYNITKDFNYNNTKMDSVWEMAAKYGIPYFSNFVNSDMNPEDARSMCLDGNEEIIVKLNGKIERTTMRDLVETYGGDGWSECNSDIKVISMNNKMKMEWVKIKNFFSKRLKGSVTIKTHDGKSCKFSENHPISVISENGVVEKKASEIKVGDFMINLMDGSNVLSKDKEFLADYVLDEDLAFLIGFFTADGNFLYDNRNGKKIMGMQFTFDSRNIKLQDRIRQLIKSKFNYNLKYKKDNRYDTSYLYLYNSKIARDWYNLGIRKYGRLPNVIFNSPKEVIKSFLEGFFVGDGYEKRQEIHIKDNLLIRDLSILYSLVGIPNILKIKEDSQRIYLQNKSNEINCKNQPVNCLYELVPGFNAESISLVSGLSKNRMVGQLTLQKYSAQTEFSNLIKNGDVYIARVTEIINDDSFNDFYDIELEKNHRFLHSLGNITHNCCRLRLDNNQLKKRGGGLFGSNPLTGSIGVVTINMPRLGYTSVNEADFFNKLGNLMELSKESLELKRKVLERFTDMGLYPYCKFYLRDIKSRFGEYWKNHFSTIGLLGMNEGIMNFMPGENIATPKGREFALKVMDFMRSKMEEYQNETGNIYNLEATPGEGTTYRFAKADKERFGKIIVANEEAVKNGSKPYYTNSTQLPVGYTDDIFEALELQDELQTKYSGGCIEKGNFVLTNKGLIKIEEIVNNFNNLKPIKALSYNPNRNLSEWDEIIDAIKINVEKNSKIRIKAERNLDIVTSDWHPFFVLGKIKIDEKCPICEKKINGIRGFANHLKNNPSCKKDYSLLNKFEVKERRADELKKGDYILQNSFNIYENKKTKLDNDLMWLIGFFIGDGCISKFIDNRSGNNLERYKLRFFSSNQDALKKVNRILTQKFNSEANIISNDKRNSVLREIGTSKKEVIKFFMDLGFFSGEKTYTINVPKKVKENLNKENVYSLISGLMDSDGHIGKIDGDFEYSTVSKNLAIDMLEILTRAGIMVSLSYKKSKRINEKMTYRLRIPSYQLTKFKGLFEIKVNPQSIKDSFPNGEKRRLPVVRVKSCSKTNVKDNQFYDLTTKNNHNYLAGNNSLVFIHNTVLHGFIGEKINKDQVKSMVKKISERFRLPYFTITPTFSICPKHGYLQGDYEYCPKCDQEIGYTSEKEGGEKWKESEQSAKGIPESSAI